MVWTAVDSAWLRAVRSEPLRQVWRAIASVSKITTTVRLLRPRDRLVIHCWYVLRSGAPPALAPPQSRLVMPYTDITGTWFRLLAALMYDETSAWMVLTLKLANQREAGWLATRSRIWGIRESPWLAATQVDTAALGSR